MRFHNGRDTRITSVLRILLLLCLLLEGYSSALAGDKERRQARRMHDRLVGIPPNEAVPPNQSVLNAMEADILGGNAFGAALRAMEDSAFYNVTLKNFATPWTNEEQTVFAPLNDYTATVIGMIRDEVPFNEVLSADIIYIGDPVLGLPGYSMTNNAHYQALEDQGIDLKSALVQRAQSVVTTLPDTATAGVMTTRAAAEAFFVAGTNRAMFRFTLINHLCNDLEQLKDTSRAPDRIRQDVSRSPGGDSRIFMNSCVGCHSGMDPMAQAFAHYNFNETSGSIEYTPNSVQSKYTINSDTFKYGYVTQDDHWDNYWRNGQNALLGWDIDLAGSGDGASSLGEELAASDAFASCQVRKVFRTVCLREPGNKDDLKAVADITADFTTDNYNMKTVFAETAVYCMGD